jgi:hypothetical protein
VWNSTCHIKEEHKLRVIETRVLRKIFGPNWGEVTANWGKLHDEKLRSLYSKPNTIKKIKSRTMR